MLTLGFMRKPLAFTLVHLLLVFSCTTLLLSHPTQGQYALDQYYQNGELLFEDHVYQPGIKSVQLHPRGNDQALPVIALNSGQQLVLKFDDLYEDFANYAYTIYHCNADWSQSSLLRNEYLGNFSEDYLTDYEYSVNALIPYTHYQVQVPNDVVHFSKSGNYLLVVYRDDDKSKLVLSRRFMVYEDRVSVGAQVLRASPVEEMNSHQEIDFTISHPNYVIQNPFRDMQVHLLQNGRFDHAITQLKPRFLQNSQLVYQYDDGENTFPGYNEFRFFDLKNLQTLSQNVRKITQDSLFHVYLSADGDRSLSQYAVWFDINGRFRIRRLDVRDSDSEADYALVDFLLPYPQPISKGDVYIFGGLTDWKMRPEFKMIYDYQRQAYRAQVFLKQGYYNYQYAVADNQGPYLVDLETLEGSHWETENEYQILVYNREIGDRYDRLVGFATFSSEELYDR